MDSTASTATHPRLVLADLVPGERVRDLLLVLGAAGFVGLSAQFSVPVPGSPVPVTGQTFAVLLAGAALGWQRGALALLLYAVAGSAGVPWFSDGGSGFGGPTFGYIFGFILAAGVVGWMASRGGDRTVARTLVSMTVGTVIVFACGLPYLMASADLGFVDGWNAGVGPFLVGAVVKILLAVGSSPAAWRLVDR
jgi:biotin transport system substrate-specific component